MTDPDFKFYSIVDYNRNNKIRKVIPHHLPSAKGLESHSRPEHQNGEGQELGQNSDIYPPLFERQDEPRMYTQVEARTQAQEEPRKFFCSICIKIILGHRMSDYLCFRTQVACVLHIIFRTKYFW